MRYKEDTKMAPTGYSLTVDRFLEDLKRKWQSSAKARFITKTLSGKGI